MGFSEWRRQCGCKRKGSLRMEQCQESQSPHIAGCNWWACLSRQEWGPEQVHNKSVEWPSWYRRTAVTSADSGSGSMTSWWTKTQEPADHRGKGSWWLCSAGGGRWPQSGHRPSQSGEKCPYLQKPWKDTSGWCSLRSWWICSVSGCSPASLELWWKWNRHRQRPGWRWRSTWGCGGGSLSWWPGWWAGSQGQWPQT